MMIVTIRAADRESPVAPGSVAGVVAYSVGVVGVRAFLYFFEEKA